MPIIDATPNINRSYVLVTTDWADVPSVSCVKVTRVYTSSGLEVPLRAYVAPCTEFGDGCIQVSGGHALFWDTEAPLDTQFHYRAEACPSFGSSEPSLTFWDSFTRVVSSGWGNLETGQVWTTVGGVASNYNVNGTKGTIDMTVVSSGRNCVAGPVANGTVYVQGKIPELATGGSMLLSLLARYTDVDNLYDFRLFINTNNTVDAQIRRIVNTTSTTLVTATNVLTHSTTMTYAMRFNFEGNILRGKVWNVSLTEPTAWTVTATDNNFSAGSVGCRTSADAGNTNIPYTAEFDNFEFVESSLGTVTVQTEPMIMPSDGDFWLKDPTRPCRDQRVLVRKSDPVCIPNHGTFFLGMDTESYQSTTTTFLPNDARRRIPAVRQRLDASSNLALATRTFADRDAVLELAQPGSPLLFQGPVGYGVPDRYLDIKNVDVQRGLQDHRYQPRVIVLPYESTDRPVGPTQGICGARVMDLCDVYQTWGQLAATGMTYEQLLMGGASQPGIGTLRTWDEVEAGFADWDAVEANGTWNELLEGN